MAKKSAQLAFEFPKRGGKRKGCGRRKLLQSELPHTRRERVDSKTPLHITMKLAPGLPNLRDPEFLEAWTKAVRRAQDLGLRFQHFSVQSDHIHTIAECDGNNSLERGMASITGSVTWALRKIFGYHGPVFASRFHLAAIKIPTVMRNTLKYVLFNNDHHTGVARKGDEFSSVFAARKICGELGEKILREAPIWQRWISDCLSQPRSWMQREGWKRAQQRTINGSATTPLDHRARISRFSS